MSREDGFLGLVVGIIIGAIATVCAVGFTISYWQQQAIKHGVAGYDKTTAEFKWNQPTAENK